MYEPSVKFLRINGKYGEKKFFEKKTCFFEKTVL